jgi:hypothetical protein
MSNNRRCLSIHRVSRYWPTSGMRTLSFIVLHLGQNSTTVLNRQAHFRMARDPTANRAVSSTLDGRESHWQESNMN